MVINHLEKLFVTSDAATIIRELEVVHPAGKVLVMASQQQEHEVSFRYCHCRLPHPCWTAVRRAAAEKELACFLPSRAVSRHVQDCLLTINRLYRWETAPISS